MQTKGHISETLYREKEAKHYKIHLKGTLEKTVIYRNRKMISGLLGLFYGLLLLLLLLFMRFWVYRYVLDVISHKIIFFLVKGNVLYLDGNGENTELWNELSLPQIHVLKL